MVPGFWLTLLVAELSGFDRVCLHKFDAEMNSMVIAEHCKQGIPSLKGLSFPASQMMCGFQQYLNQHIMICIDDVHSQPVKLIAVRQAEALPEPDQCLGLSWMPPASYLKMLKALDVKSVLVIAIFQDNKLWGSINCHSFTSKPLSSSIRDVSFNLVQMATQRLFLLTTQEQNLFQQRVMDSRQVLSDKRERLTEPAEMFADYAADWCELFCASGVVLVFDDDVFRHGNSPANQPLEKIISGLGEQKKACFYTESLGNLFPEIAEQLVDCCGLLAISLPYDHHRPGWLLLFRPEATIEFKWAVKPEHLTEKNASQSEQSSYWSEIVRGESQPWTPIERQAAMDLGEDLAVVIAVHQISKLNQRFSETNQRLEQLAHTDTLTQIWNRYRMELAIDAEVAASSRYGRPCSLLLFDIDHFKQINDNFGHDVGDAVLAGIAWEVKTLLRASDHLGRWGGEEFIVLASNTDLAEAEKLAERLCRHIYALELETVGRISVSIGVTEWQTGDMRRDIVERADKAMYEAKETGRNRWLSNRKR
ncbi:sensor domain-containing diguanylate cyclase [Methylophaga lonarensis]|nr:sensor domain-containing diguanylate cyclase [Methylophaga lonarensis]